MLLPNQALAQDPILL